MSSERDGPSAERAAVEASAPLVERRVSKTDRRKTTLKTFIQGGFRPRRRTGRRASDHEQPLDWHDPQLLVLALAMLSLSVADALMTLTLLGKGAVESNPLLAYVLAEHPHVFAAVKMALTGASIVLLVAVAQSRLLGLVSARRVFQCFVAAYFALVAYELWLLGAIG